MQMNINPNKEKKIAMWSGPRNLSTAMMYSFAQRSDTSVVDEPFYAAYLATTDIQHAMYQEIIDAGQTDATKVADYCVGTNPQQKPVFYQKQMTKHMIPSFNREWIYQVCNVFLIRDPARVIASYHAKHEDPELADIGVKEQLALFEMISQKSGSAPTVIDSADILENPELMLTALCKAIGIEFQPNMLNWTAGPKDYDGVWAPHWYKSVWQSTGFAAPDNKQVEIPEHLLGLLETANSYYDRLKGYAIVAPQN